MPLLPLATPPSTLPQGQCRPMLAGIGFSLLILAAVHLLSGYTCKASLSLHSHQAARTPLYVSRALPPSHFQSVTALAAAGRRRKKTPPNAPASAATLEPATSTVPTEPLKNGAKKISTPVYDAWKVEDLQGALRDRGLPSSMTKADLISRLERADGKAPDATDPVALQQLQKTLQEKTKSLELLRQEQARAQSESAAQQAQLMGTISTLETELKQAIVDLQNDQQGELVLQKSQELEQLRQELSDAQRLVGSAAVMGVLAGGAGVLLLWILATAVLVVLSGLAIGTGVFVVGAAAGYTLRRLPLDGPRS